MMFERLINRVVLVRSNMSGVWIGTLRAVSNENNEPSALLTDAAKIHAWSGAAATSGLALYGPGSGSRICEDVPEVVVSGCCEIILCSPPATEAMAKINRWKA